MHVDCTAFGRTRCGAPAHRIALRNRAGTVVHVSDHGATLVAVHVRDRSGRLDDVVLGFDDVAGYETHADRYLGATIGRVANRIAGARFTLDGETWQLAANEGRNHLHGGVHRSLDKVLWRFEVGTADDRAVVELRHTSLHREEGYPGTVSLCVRFTLDADSDLRIDYEATTDHATPVNLTNHAYWNLGGQGSGTVLDHELTVHASLWTPTDGDLIPTGGYASVAGTPLDLRQGKRIVDGIEALRHTPTGGYDHNLVLDDRVAEPTPAARLVHPPSGRVLEILTTEPGLQVYSGNSLRAVRGKLGATYPRYGGVCLEAQHFPDAVHHPTFPPVVLSPGGVYRQTTIHRLRAE